MQSPMLFDPKNAQAYSNIMPFLSDEAKNGMAQGQLPLGMNGGLITPGESRLLGQCRLTASMVDISGRIAD